MVVTWMSCGPARPRDLPSTSERGSGRRPEPPLKRQPLDQRAAANALLTRWYPYFGDTMTLAEVIQYATQHFDHHKRQLTLQDRRSK